MSEPIPTDPVVDPDFPPEEPVPPEPDPVEPGPEMPVVGGWLDAAAQAEADAKQYTDEQVPLVAGRMVPRNMDRAPTVEDGADLIAGTGWNQYDPVTNDLVQMWRWDGTAWQALDMSAEMIPVLDIGSATVGDLTGGRINVADGPIIAGNPDGARVEMTSDGLHAYDATGTETAAIQGEGGVFVGGEFRSSDNNPKGQFIISDDAYVHPRDGYTTPGIQFVSPTPEDYTYPAGIGTIDGDVRISGGRHTDGRSSDLSITPSTVVLSTGNLTTPDRISQMSVTDTGSHLVANDNASGATASMRANHPIDIGGVRAADGQALIRAAEDGSSGELLAEPTRARVQFNAGGVRRELVVDADGVWVKSETDEYNLLETAQDSGWHSFSPVAGMDSYALAWRNKGGVIYMRGTVTATWSAGWTTVATNLPAEMRPAIRVVRQSPSTSEQGLYFRVGNDGVLEFNKPTAGTRTGDLSAIFYPAD